jgi:hypothetical protein
MIIKKKNVYYCEYCKKKSLRSVKIHEKHCTANPDRECRLCDNKSIKPIIEKYQEYFHIKETKSPTDWDEIKITPVFKKGFTLEDLTNELDYECPNCILALIRCLDLNRYWMDKKYKFNYKEALSEWWAMENKKAWEEDEHNSIYY